MADVLLSSRCANPDFNDGFKKYACRGLTVGKWCSRFLPKNNSFLLVSIMEEPVNQQLSAFEAACRKSGLRLTPQRIEIFRELANAVDHPSAEALHLRLIKKMPTLSLDTVYRTLATFVGHGLVNKVETVESQARFEAADVIHHHLVCERCKQIMDFEWPRIDEAELPEGVRGWGRVDRKSVVVYGICNQCLER